ncbi:MAG: DUF4440 domain-containing protein [Pseudomonadales bacterium]|nr:DUF4440 domain-containing protein [Pseudomonadales bacterium]
MKTIVSLKNAVAVVTLFWSVLILGQENSMNDYQQLEELNKGYLDSYRSGKADFFNRVLADDFRETAADGTILNRAQFLQKISEFGNAQADPITVTAGELEIRIFGDTAIVHAIPIVTMADGTTFNGGRYTDVYARIDGQWLCVAAHLGGS